MNQTQDEWLERHRSLGPYERVGYVGLGEQYNKCLYKLRRSHFLRLARRQGLSAEHRVLDVGFGTGFYLDLYREMGLRNVHGLDLSPDAVVDAQPRFPGFELSTGDITQGLPADACYDWVSAMDVLFHIVDDQQFTAGLRACGEAVAKGGLLVISDNFPQISLAADEHQSFHTLREYQDILSPQGLELSDLSPVFILSNGQVTHRAWPRSTWNLFARVLGKSIRTSKPLGESLGLVSGLVLTLGDSILHRQGAWKGHSTKIAVFKRS